MVSKEKKRCMYCRFCHWLNGWHCENTRWEFDIWAGTCNEFVYDKESGAHFADNYDKAYESF